jgi:hypothetical protein
MENVQFMLSLHERYQDMLHCGIGEVFCLLSLGSATITCFEGVAGSGISGR